MLKLRILTALILLPLVILGILYLPPTVFAVCSALIVGWCAYEWAALLKLTHWWKRLIFAVAVMLSTGFVHFIPMLYWLSFSVLIWLWAFAAIVCYAKQKNTLGFHHRWLQGLLAFFMLVPFWLSLNVLRLTIVGPILLVFVFVLIWAVDTGAYFVGRALGKRHLIPRVSPKKTWEGLAGGVALAILLALAYSFFHHLSLFQLFILSVVALITALFSVIGDLFESLLKRQANSKDSGTLLPGHGGIYDRLDSAIAALPIFTFCLMLFRG